MMQAVFPPGVIAVTLSGPISCLQNQRAGGVLFGRDMASKPWLDHDFFFGDDDAEGGHYMPERCWLRPFDLFQDVTKCCKYSMRKEDGQLTPVTPGPRS